MSFKTNLHFNILDYKCDSLNECLFVNQIRTNEPEQV